MATTKKGSVQKLVIFQPKKYSTTPLSSRLFLKRVLAHLGIFLPLNSSPSLFVGSFEIVCPSNITNP
ncbi:hypothetical protein M1N05_01700, partial [Dehalococcoidales bacterium]|nr:hypothetical protein [Dehalococcoidales bacterium]